MQHIPRTADFNFDTFPPIGWVVEVRGLRYELLSQSVYTRSDGVLKAIGYWRGQCQCGQPFEFISGRRVKYVRRNCDDHKGFHFGIV